MDTERDFRIGEVEIHLEGDLYNLKGVVAKVKTGCTTTEIPIDFSWVTNPREIDLKRAVIANIIAYFEYRRLTPKHPVDIIISNAFFKSIESLKDSYDEDLIQEGKMLGGKRFNERLDQFKIELQVILTKLRDMGFTVDLGEDETFIFKFVNRKAPLEIKVPKYTPLYNQEVLKEMIKMEDYKQFYTIDDVLNVAEKKLKPAEGKRCMKSTLATWQEFQDIAYKNGKISLVEKSL